MKRTFFAMLLAGGIFCVPAAGIANGSTSAPPANATQSSVVSPPSSSSDTNLPKLEVAQAVVVTAELDFGPKLPSIAEALPHIERRHEPEDGKGRTFAILDAWGQPTEDGKKLHISMHLSTEKPGVGSLVFKRTGEVFWKNRIVPATKPPSSSFAGKGLAIMIDDGQGKPQLVDGSKVKSSIFETTIHGGEPIDVFWPEDETREVTLFYSSCGCPVKVVARREGDKTVRLKDTPVIFPDDPAVAATINRVMGWK